MLHLRHIRALRITERWVRLDQVIVDQVLKRHEMPCLPNVVKPTAAKRECAKILLDGVQEGLRALDPQRYVGGIEDLHVVRTLQILDDVTLAAGCERLDSVELALLHDGGFVVLNDGDRLASVYLVGPDGVPVQVFDRFDRQRS